MLLKQVSVALWPQLLSAKMLQSVVYLVSSFLSSWRTRPSYLAPLFDFWPFSLKFLGHNAILHACTVGDESLIGMGATLLDGSVVESGAVVAAGSLVLQNARVPTGQVCVIVIIVAFFSVFTFEFTREVNRIVSACRFGQDLQQSS